MLRALAVLVPRSRRVAWISEWRAEFEHFDEKRRQRPDLRFVSRRTLLLSATEDALRLRLRGLRPAEALRDVGFAFRTLRSAPAFTIIAVVTLALGIGANTAIFTVVNALLLRPLGYPNSERLVQLVAYRETEETNTLAYLDMLDYGDRARTLDAVGYLSWWQPVFQADEPRRVQGSIVSSSYFQMFAEAPALGRYFDATDDAPNSDPAVVVSYDFWQRHLGGDPEAVGRVIEFDGAPYELVGVTAPGFRDLLMNADVWRDTPAYLAQARRSQSWLLVWGRLAEGVTLTAAQAEVTGIATALEQEYPDSNRDRRVRLVPLRERLVGTSARASLVLLGAVVIVLAIACLNVATLLLTRATQRGREIAVRQSLGAGRGRLVRQLATESLVLSVLGGGAGFGLAIAGLRTLERVVTVALPGWVTLALDARVMGFAGLATLATGLAFGLTPVWMVTSSDLVTPLREGGRGSTSGRRGQQLRSTLVLAEVALSTVLLVLAGLMIRSTGNLADVDTGLVPERVLSVRVTPSINQSVEELNVFYRQLRDRITAIPGVVGLGTIDRLPLSGAMSSFEYTVEGGAPNPSDRETLAETRAISPGYFETLGINLLGGRAPADADVAAGASQVWINAALQRRDFGAASVLGRSIVIFGTPHEIVGVVSDVHQAGPATPVVPAIYALRSSPSTPAWMAAQGALAIRVDGDPGTVSAAVRGALRELDPAMPLDDIGIFVDQLDRYLAGPRLQALLLTAFAVLATLLATVGIAGVIGHSVAARTAEIGLRRALGAQDGDVARLLLGQGGRLAVLGTGSGLLIAALLAPMLGDVLFGVRPHDGPTFAVVALLLSSVALVAVWVPARRATRIDPARALAGD